MTTSPIRRDIRGDLLRALDFNYVVGVLGYSTPEELLAAYDTNRTPAPKPSPPASLRDTAEGLVAHGDPIDIGWIGGSLDARLHLYVRPGMDPLERDQLLADLRDTIAVVVPVRRASQEVKP